LNCRYDKAVYQNCQFLLFTLPSDHGQILASLKESQMHVKLIGTAVNEGAARLGCDMGPAAYRAAKLPGMLTELGHQVSDLGDVVRATAGAVPHSNSSLKNLGETIAWTEALAKAAYEASADGMPIFMGGDHSLSAGTVAGIARRADENGKPLFVLWLDAHTDFHTLDTTESGHIHGTPVAYFTGQAGFEGYFPPLAVKVDPANVMMMGIRSVDPAERKLVRDAGVNICDMRMIDEEGVAAPLTRFLKRIKDANGALHVSLDVDFLDPSIAPAVGTDVPGGATFREAHLIMEILHDSGLVMSLDLVELNPFLDERGRTAVLMSDLAASLLGKQVMDRPPRSFV
jgi:arginase